MVAGIFSNTLKKCANWFLYIFISSSANLPAAIMRKRRNQINWLKTLDRLNGYYNFAELVKIVESGIVERYGKKPDEVLQLIYNTASGAAKVGSAILDAETAKATANLQIMATDTTTGQKSNANLWQDIATVIAWLTELFKTLGIGNKTTSISTSTPTADDWANVNDMQSEAGIGTYLPWIVGAAVVATLMTSGKKQKTK